MYEKLIGELEKEIEVGVHLNETIKQFKEVVAEFNFNLEYFEETYKVGETTAKTIENIKVFSDNLKAVNEEYKKLLKGQQEKTNLEATLFNKRLESVENTLIRRFEKMEEKQARMLQNMKAELMNQMMNQLQTHFYKTNAPNYPISMSEPIDDDDLPF